MRSLLRLSVSAPDNLLAGMRCRADVLILDEPDPVTLARSQTQQTAIYIQIDEDRNAPEIEAITEVGPDGIVLAGAKGNASVLRLSAVLAAYEAIAGLDAGAIGIIALLTSATGLFGAASLQDASNRLRGVGWDAARLATSVGAESPWGPDGTLIGVCRTARSQCLLAAAAAGVPAFDTIDQRPGATDRFLAEAKAARRDGFAGKFAANPEQVSAINQAFARD